jgi:hypothetical protein
MVEYMFIIVLFIFLGLYLVYYIFKKEYYEDSFDGENKKEQVYSNKLALRSLEIFITTLNKDKNELFTIYYVENIKQITNKLYIKCFVQHVEKKYVRVYFVELQLPFKKKSDPVLTYYSEFGNGQTINNGSYDVKDSANYANYHQGFRYTPDKYYDFEKTILEIDNSKVNEIDDIAYF